MKPWGGPESWGERRDLRLRAVERLADGVAACARASPFCQSSVINRPFLFMAHLPGGQRRDRALSLLPTPYTSRWQHMRLTPTALHLSGGQAQKRALCRVALWRLTWTCESVGVAEGADDDEPPPKMKLSSCGCPGYMAANPASFRLPNGWGKYRNSHTAADRTWYSRRCKKRQEVAACRTRRSRLCKESKTALP